MRRGQIPLSVTAGPKGMDGGLVENTGRLISALSSRYRVDREIDRGGMAIVYLAQDLKHNRQVAVKVLRPELTSMLPAQRLP